MKFIHELRRRRVFQTAAIYIVAAWIILQVADLAFPGLDIPENAIRYVWIGAFLGFPIALVFGWRYQITSQGIVRTAPLASGESAGDLGLNKNDYVLLSALALIVVAISYGVVGEIRQVEQPFGVSTFGREIHPNSIAVLPLSNLTGDPDQEYFVDGLHDAMISDLSQISALHVTSRTSASVYKYVAKSMTEIGRELGVANVIEGSVFRTGNQVRITVQLINAATDEHLWAKNYQRDVTDMLTMQGEIARAIAEQVRVTLTPDEVARLTRTRQINPDVYESYLKGMFFMKQLDPDAIPKALQYLHDAIGIDPREPLAYAGLALGYNTIGHGLDTHGAFPKALAAARKALDLDEYSGEAWAALGEAQLYYDWDWWTADESFRRALQLSPSLDHVRAHYAYLLALLGRVDESFIQAEKARDLSPLDPIWAFFASWLYMTEGRWEEAISGAEECMSLSPGFPFCRYGLGQIYTAQGEFEKAIEIHEKMDRGTPPANWSLGPTYGMAGRHDEAREIAKAMAENPTPRDLLHLALTYSAMGETDEALRWLEVAFEARSDWLPWIVLDNAYGGAVEPLRNEPRFRAIVAKLNLPQFDEPIVAYNRVSNRSN
jgi:TolB-like protein/Flp pilus assembly protein TadD